MTESRDFKRLVRQRMAETGESYTQARSHFDAPPKPPAVSQPSGPLTVAEFKRKFLSRRRIKDLGAHLEETYDIQVVRLTELDLGVYRVDRRGASSWVARVFSSERSMEAVRGDAEVLAYLEEKEFPAERLIDGRSISVMAGQPVLLTEWVEGSNRRSDTSDATMHSLGRMVGRLHTFADLPPGGARAAGSWHHLSANGGPRRNDIDVILMLLPDAATSSLRAELNAFDDFADLPTALMHPDPLGANLVAHNDEEGVLVDWAGAGSGPRIASLATLIGSAPWLTSVDAIVAGYREHAVLEERELDRLGAALVQFPFVIDCFSVLFQRAPLDALLQRLGVHRQRAAALAARARSAFEAELAPSVVDSGSEQERLF